jgi:ethanolamine utilization microcompartment shell protein EutL
VDACGDRAFKVLTTLGYSAVVRNGNYSYGNLNGNRAAVKCAENSGNSFVYFAVAGPRKEKVEELRNAIARTF